MGRSGSSPPTGFLWVILLAGVAAINALPVYLICLVAGPNPPKW